MSLQSIGFFGFLLVVAAVYLHLPQRWQNPFLLAASWYFYAKAMPAMLPVTIAVAACTYACGRAMQRHKTAALRVGVIGLLVILPPMAVGRLWPCRWASAFTASRPSAT